MAKKPKIVKVGQIRPRLVDTIGAARYLGLSPKTIRNRVGAKAEERWKKGRGPKPVPFKPRYMGGKPLYEVSELDTYIDSLDR